ncbi:hypothetical protein FF011L_38050 [Roseimaritima multifibrata]|uniref:Planctomycete cytochrome C n=1 Tax=Roseimaritima multifibrata TaxID=1930274 RepID=A0A517MJE7_9BACT|nr:DUF1592 domain-containing protein [Roseimaritima multifibrata]QDS95021.1 hypothetical protein FF011L_38050 [Roseimaritima multifibrata]
MRLHAVPSGLSLLLLVFIACPARTDEPVKKATPQSSSAMEAYLATGADLVRSHCLDCHNEDFQEAEVDLSAFADPEKLAADQELWRRALQMIKFGAMPPADAEPFTDTQREAFVHTLTAALNQAACDLDPKPGKVTVRRLNRSEYDNTVSDLFKTRISVAADFPQDEVGAGFDNNGDVLSVPPMLFEKYIAAAEQISKQVVFDPSTIEKKTHELSGDQIHVVGESWVGSFFGHFLAKDAFAWTEVTVPYAGKYRLEISAGAPKKGEKVRIGVFNAAGEPLGEKEFDYFGGGGSSDREALDVNLKKGLNRFLFALLPPEEKVVEDKDKDKDKDKAGDDKAKAAEVAKAKEKEKKEQEAADEAAQIKLPDFALLTDQVIAEGRAAVGKTLKISRKIEQLPVVMMIRKASFRGPSELPDEIYPASHRVLITVTPKKGVSNRQAAKECLKPFLRRAFRGPVDDATVDRYARLAEMASKREKSFERGMQVAVSAILLSPRFLFRSELPGPDSKGKPGDVQPIEDFQLASRLSYFLWSSMPDEELLQLAAEGRLNDEAVLRDQVKRMIADKRAVALADNFAAQWLGLRNLDVVEPNTDQFPQFDDSLRNAMRTETLMVFQDVVDNNRSVVTLLDSPETFLNERLAKHYGIDGVKGDDFRRVSVAEHGRAGILTHASVLTLTSYPGRTSPVLRGKWVLENILGTRPPDPPPGVPELDVTSEANPTASLRKQLEQHRADPGCASCHVVMDDIGFGLDHFGPIGNYRDDDNGKPIDSTGTLPGGRAFDGALPLIQQIRDAETASFVETVANRLLTYAIGRELTVTDTCFLVDVVAQSAKQDHRFVDLATAVVLSKPFRFHTLEEN